MAARIRTGGRRILVCLFRNLVLSSVSRIAKQKQCEEMECDENRNATCGADYKGENGRITVSGKRTKFRRVKFGRGRNNQSGGEVASLQHFVIISVRIFAFFMHDPQLRRFPIRFRKRFNLRGGA